MPRHRVIMNRAVDLALHFRLVAGDKTAPDECVVQWLPELIRQLSIRFYDVATRDEHIITAAAIDALLDYTSSPHKYDPQRSSLWTYLFMAARRDLLNALRRDRTQSRGAISIHSIEQSLSSGNNTFEEHILNKADAQVAWETVKSEITDPLDRRILDLLLQGERSTAAYAKALGIQHLPEQEQKIIVKRHKDRISKRLERLGESMRG